jgi:hypothetical protein
MNRKRIDIDDEILKFTDNDYTNLCEIANSNFLFKTKCKVIIQYNDIYMWCILTKKRKFIKTIYPVDRSDIRKYLFSKK